MFSRKAAAVEVGQRFVKAKGGAGLVWVVDRLFEPVPGRPHVRLVRETGGGASITIALTVLTDNEFFLPVSDAA
ncbi:MAG: hypothetical protein H7841_07935 [Magnetospirillum sp. WYHS-4]